MSNENLNEKELSNNKQKFKQIEKLGIILEENNSNNSLLERSKRNQILNNDTNHKRTIQNHSYNFKHFSFLNENSLDKEIFYQTQKLFFNKKLFNDIIKNKSSSNKKINKNNGKYKKITTNKNKPEDIIILNSCKKKTELIKLISSNNSDKTGNENYTKNINLNININNNIQYEIEKNKEKGEENNELNQSLNSLLKIAEKNCFYFNDTLNPDFYNNKNLTVNKSKEKNKEINDLKDKEKSIKIKKDKSSSRKKNEKINLSSYSHPVFSKVPINKNKKSKLNENKREKKNEADNIKNENINKNVNKNKTKRIIPTRNNNSKIYNKKKSIPKQILNKTNRNLSFKLKIKEEKPTIYRRAKNVFSIGKIKQKMKENKEEDNNYFIKNNNNKEIISNDIKNNVDYQTSTYNRNNKNSLNNLSYYNRNTFNEINSLNFKENKFSKHTKFFEVNVSLDNFFPNNNYFERSLEYESNKIYKRPTIFNNIIKKVKSLDKLKSSQDINSFNTISSRRNQIKTDKNIIGNKANINYINNNNEIKTINAYVKKNPQNNLSTNINIYQYQRSRNKDLNKERNTITNYNISYYNLKKYEDIYNNSAQQLLSNNKINFSTKFQDLLILEEKLCDIILGLKKDKKADNQSLDFLIFYFTFSVYKQLEKIFKNDIDEEIVRLSLNYELISILLCYKFSINNEIIDISPFIEILQLCHINLINIYEELLNQFIKENKKSNIWIEKLNEIVNFSKKSSEHVFHSKNYNMDLIDKINFNTNCLIKKIKNILYKQKFDNKNIIINFIKSLNQKTYEEIDSFFKVYIYVINNPEGSILPQVFRPIQTNKQFQNYPFIKIPNKKRCSLILDLNETLVSLRYANNSKGLIRIRPFLYEFLDAISLNYEVILFTGSTENYTNSIVEVLERNKKYFDFIFHRQYLVKCGDCYIKDLSKIGRPLDSTIIIDNNPLNFKLHKENGIYIKSFWGDNINDTALNDLIPILTNIAKDKKDVRDGIFKYKDEIISKISANIF